MKAKAESMTDWFKRGSQASRVHLAAFGKHPGWEDHIPGIGVDTEALAGLKQSLYFDGIRGQIDSGAWEKMEQFKRIEGFDHVFLWIRPGHVLLGLMWSSSDRIGRAKYPMILCADGEGFSPAFMLAHAKPELERLRDTCRALASAEEVTAQCRGALDRLRGTFERAQAGWIEPFSDNSERRRFLDCPELSPDRGGFLRVLHEYSTEQGMGSTEPNAKHLRVPVIAGLQADVFVPWVEFFRCVVPPKNPVLFIKRESEGFLDVIVGEPASRDFFCLQAATDAVPLTTQVPYEISSRTRAALDTVSARLGLQANSARVSSAEARPVPRTPADSAARPRRGVWPFLLFGLIVVVVLAGVALALFLNQKNPAGKNSQPPVKKATVSAPSQVAVDGVKYETAIQAATDAFAKGDYDEAIREANMALSYEPGDSAALQIKGDSMNKKRDAEVQARSYTAAMTAGSNALAAGRYAEAEGQVKNALAIRPGDAAALQLDSAVAARRESDGEKQQRAMADTQARQNKYDEAMTDGRAALSAENGQQAVREAEIALTFKPGDAEAQKLMTQGRNLEIQSQQQKKYEMAMQAARQALDGKDFQSTIQQADAALLAKPGDADAAALKAKAEKAEAAEQAYQVAMEAAQKAFDGKSYQAAIQQADDALAARPGDSAATALKSNATSEWNIQQNGQQYQSELDAMQSAWTRNNFDGVIQNAARALQIAPGQADIKAKLRDAVYNKLEIYAVWFGVIKPQDATFPMAKSQSPLAQGDIAPATATAYRNQIDGWIKLLNYYHLTDDAHVKLAGAIKESINHY